jgi:tetratricopeptide (TPR) repeat protein
LLKALACFGWNVDAFKKRGVTYTKLKQFEKAVQDFDQAIKLNPKHTNAFNNRGVAYTGLKQFEKAVQDFDQAIKLNPKHANAFNNRGVAYADLKQFEKAIQDYDQAQHKQCRDREKHRHALGLI